MSQLSNAGQAAGDSIPGYIGESVCLDLNWTKASIRVDFDPRVWTFFLRDTRSGDVSRVTGSGNGRCQYG